MNNNLKEQLLFLVTGFLLATILFSSLKCKKNTNNQDIIHDTITKESVRIDTIRTIEYKNKWNTIVKYSKDTIKLSFRDTVNLAYLRVYEDSLIEKDLAVYTKDSIYGKLKSQKISYLLNKQEITKTIKDSIFITKAILQKHDLFNLWGGLAFGGSTTLFNSISPYIKLNIGNKDYSYKYNILQNSHEIGIGFKIW